MPGNSDHRFQSSEPSSTGSAVSHSHVRERLKAFLKRLDGKRISIPTSGGNVMSVFGKRAWRLSYCCEEAFDATTLEDAMKWQGRIVRELTRRIEIVAKKEWPANVKSKILLELMHQRVNHNRLILNIDQALQREEEVEWQWW